MAASYWGHVDTVRILIEAKAEVNIQDKVLCSYHNTPSQCAVHAAPVYIPVVKCSVGVSTGWLDCSSPGSSRRQS